MPETLPFLRLFSNFGVWRVTKYQAQARGKTSLLLQKMPLCWKLHKHRGCCSNLSYKMCFQKLFITVFISLLTYNKSKTPHCVVVIEVDKRLTWIKLAEMCVRVQRCIVLGRAVEQRCIYVSFMATVKLQACPGTMPTHLYSRCYHGETYGWYPGNQTAVLELETTVV